jgi:long-subunit acyl-CoA synthetase (AMP-forming)
LARQVRSGGGSLLICSEDFVEISREALKEVERKVTLLVLSTEPDYSLRIDGLDFDDGELRGTTMPERLTWERITDPKKLKESLIVLLYSSGTTGEPKGRRGKEDPKADNTYTNGIQASCSPI